MTHTGEIRLTSVHLTIHGRVQGVYFRDSMYREAHRRGIVGWVRNCSDGSVEAAVQGDADAVDAIVRWAHHGPAHARVEHVQVDSYQGEHISFEIIF